MKKLFLLVIVFLGTILLFAPNKAEASHASAGYITYQYLSPNTYQLTLHFYRDCTGVSEPGSATVQYNSSCGGGGSITLPKAPGINGQPVEQSPCVPPVNTTCTGGSAYGVREWIYTGVVTLPIACADWTFSYSLCCRNPATTLVGSGNFYIETTLNSVAAPTNTSPSFSNIGISQFCVGSPVIWNQFATDPDNDSLAYTLVCPQINAGTSVNFVPPRSCLSPISAAPAVNLNAVTGQMTFTPNAAQVAVLAVKVSEYRGGVLIGSVTRDMQVNMVSNCTVIPFDNAWLGFNNNWDDPINWCKGVPTLTTSAVVRSVGGPGYVSPIIKNNIVAEAKSLKILNGDSVTINASTNGSLTMADSLINDSKLIVKGSFFGSEKFGPGNLVASAQFTPFAANRSDARMQIIYRATDLLGSRMLPGDEIYELCFHIFRRRSIDAYQNFSIRYFTTNQTSFAANINATPTSAVTTVYTNAAGESLLAIPFFQSGTHSIVLDQPIVWNGSDFVLEICFDEFTPNPSNNTDLMTQTTTGTDKTVLLHEQTAFNFAAQGCANLTNGPQVLSTISEHRPNITFKYFRPYTEYPINISGNWHNDGDFVAADSRVTFEGVPPLNLNQHITGANVTTFDDVEVNKPLGGQVMQFLDVVADSTLTLSAGNYTLNANTLSINYGANNAISAPGGYILSENLPPNYGIVKWNIGNNSGPFVIPFGNILSANIPLTFTPNTGDFGEMEFSTYKTAPSNVPYPLAVTSIPYAFNEVVDRFWNISRSTGGGIDADISFRYQDFEDAVPSTVNKHATRWAGAGAWDLSAPFVPYLTIGNTREVAISNITNIQPTWTISNEPNPLPIQLINFDGEARNNHNYLWWTTATEMNADRFEVEKTLDLASYDLIGSVKAQGYSISEQHYELRDNNPVHGLQYYRLKSIDFDGSFEYSKNIAVYYGPESVFEVIALSPNKASNNISIDFAYNSNKDLHIVITDIVGKVIHEEVFSRTSGENHHLDISADFSSAFYFITFYNEDLKETKKLSFQ